MNRTFADATFSDKHNSLVTFFLQLTRYLQQSIGTVAAIDLNAYAQSVGFTIDEKIQDKLLPLSCSNDFDCSNFMKPITIPDIRRLEKKINLLNDKLDRLMEAQGVALQKTQVEVDKEEEKKRKACERQQAKIISKQNSERQFERFKEDLHLRFSVGNKLQSQFNLLLRPSADRIREYQRTNSPKAFNGLKRRE